MTIFSNLYPPIMPDVLPAFDRADECKIYFSLSKYNSGSEIKSVQISFVNQRTNSSALKTDEYPSGIKAVNSFNQANDEQAYGDYNYYVTITPDDLINNEFELNQFYKIQLRFSTLAAPTQGKELATWIYANQDSFSQWSKVCLVKGIEKPTILIHGFNNTEDNQETVLTDPLIDIVGRMSYENRVEENEYLKSYNIKIYYLNDLDTLLFDSGEIYTNSYNPNELNYQVSYDFLDGVEYTMILTYTTNNLYSSTLKYNFTIVQSNVVSKLKADIVAVPESENGRIKITLTSTDETEDFIGSFTIRRTSSESDFHRWEDVKTDSYETKAQLNYVWYDMTVKSGVWYKYCAQRRNSNGDRSAIIQIDTPVMCLFDDIFLSAEGRQLKIMFNPSLNEFKYNVSESQQTTIGSKFPFVKRNGANYFRTFPLGGLISSLIDMSNWYDPHFYDGEFHSDENEIKAFTSKQAVYNNSKDYYDGYNSQNGITEYDDYIYEREFREQVYDFLYKHNVKLFRSTTEGNILVKLMNIDFQPVQSLGRRLYSFTATAVEVDQATTANYDKYHIQTVGDYQKYILYEYNTLGQISGTYSESDGNILQNKISSKYEKSANTGFINKVNGLTSLKLQIESDPYVIIEQGGTLIKADSSSTINPNNAVVGYIVKINGSQIIIRANPVRYSTDDLLNTQTIYELEDDVFITDLQFKYPTTVSIDYTASLREVEDTSYLVSRVYYYQKPGQLQGVFYPQDTLMKKIYNKYLLNYTTYYQRLLDVTGVKLESDPGTVVYIKDSRDSDYNRHILENGFLHLEDSKALITDLYFNGVHLIPANESRSDAINELIANSEQTNPNECRRKLQMLPIRSGEFVLITGNQYNSLQDVSVPVRNGVYEISSNKYIYYKDNWYTFTDDNDVICPVEGLVDYYCEVIKGVYKKNGV